MIAERFRSGFSDRKTSSHTISMPSLAFPVGKFIRTVFNPTNGDREKPHITLAPLDFCGPHPLCVSMSERFGVSRVEVINVERSPNNPFYEKWIGTLRMGNEEIKFTTNDGMDEGEYYRVVWNRTESIIGEEILNVRME